MRSINYDKKDKNSKRVYQRKEFLFKKKVRVISAKIS